jgi:hypothetical protein
VLSLQMRDWTHKNQIKSNKHTGIRCEHNVCVCKSAGRLQDCETHDHGFHFSHCACARPIQLHTGK